jgi:myo-inositol-1(or 4)-monophosphatase
MSAYSAELAVMVRAAHRAAAGLMRDFAHIEKLRIAEKKPSDFVSSADLRSQETLRAELASAYPDHELLLEEGARTVVVGARGRFLVDPLDGTTNFLHGVPHFSVSIALEVLGDVVAGTVLNPASGELFWAEKGRGAWLGDRRLAVSRERELSRSMVGTGIPHRGGQHHAHYLGALGGLMPRVAGIRRMGSAALDLAYVAAGRFEAYFEQGLAPWDVAAGALLTREAGGLVTKSDGTPMRLDDRDILATNGGLHAPLMALLAPLHRASALAD